MNRPSHGKPTDVKEVIELYKSGLSISEVGRRTGHPHGIISYHLHKNGIMVRHPLFHRKVWTNMTTEDMSSLYLSGKSLSDIAGESGISSQSVYTRLYKSGTKVRSIREAINLAYSQGKGRRRYGSDHHSWKDGYIDKNGYKKISMGKGHHGKQCTEHKMVWEKQNGPLPRGWIIHHLNGDRADNRIENLCAMPRKRHSPILIIEPFKKRILELERRLAE